MITATDTARDHGHSHGLVDASIKRSREGIRAVLISLLVLGATAAAQIVVFILSGSIALLADLIHNVGDALTAVPLGAAFLMHSFKAEKYAGYFVVATIFVSACVAFGESVDRLINPQHLTHLWALAGAGVIGFLGNEVAAFVRLRAGRRLQSPALVADGYHARTDGIVSLAVVASAIFVALGVPDRRPADRHDRDDRDPADHLAVLPDRPRRPRRPTPVTPPPTSHVDGPKTPDGEFSAHQQRAVEELERLRLRAPCRVANASRNAEAGFGRRRRWRPARDALWDFVGPLIEDGARVAIVGAGNGDDLPLRRIARRAGSVTLIDLDPPRGTRARVSDSDGRSGRRST